MYSKTNIVIARRL